LLYGIILRMWYNIAVKNLDFSFEMDMVYELAYAKINLQLNILGKRADGYHEVDMLMQTIDFCDEVVLERSPKPGIVVETNIPELNNRDNLACRAAELLAGYAGISPQLKITIRKNIFQAAGLAGGSADAAAVLRGLNKMWNLNYSCEQLEKIAGELGSDIPFLIQGGTVRARGRGEILEHLPDAQDRYVILAKPTEFGISTKWAYAEFDKVQQPHEETGNVFELVAFPEYPMLGEMKKAALVAGAEKAMMSGSGPTMYALTDNEKTTDEVKKIWEKYPVEIKTARFVGRMK